MAHRMQMQQVEREEMTAIIARVPAQVEVSSLATGVIIFGLKIKKVLVFVNSKESQII